MATTRLGLYGGARSPWGAFAPKVAGRVITLTSPGVGGIGITNADPYVSTDTPSGILYCVVTTRDTAPSAAQIVLGQDDLGNPAVFADSALP